MKDLHSCFHCLPVKTQPEKKGCSFVLFNLLAQTLGVCLRCLRCFLGAWLCLLSFNQVFGALHRDRVACLKQNGHNFISLILKAYDSLEKRSIFTFRFLRFPVCAVYASCSTRQNGIL
jgi:hypothetical protein